MSDLIELVFERLIQYGMPMAVEVDPDRGGSIEVTRSVGIYEVRPRTSFDDQRVLQLPFLHLGKRVPEVSSVPVAKGRSGLSLFHAVVAVEK